MTLTVKILAIIFTGLIAFAFGLVRLGINRLLKGQDEARLDGKKRVNKIRDDIKDIGIKVSRHNTRLAIIETKCDIKHPKRRIDDD